MIERKDSMIVEAVTRAMVKKFVLVDPAVSKSM